MAAHFDPRVSLAAALESQPGVYALLIGSGVSTGAGVPTGWGVVDSLVRRVAVASGDTLEADFDAETWWSASGDGKPLGYSSILERLGITRAARRALLAGFFEPSDEDRENELKVPSAAHRAIASLVRAGRIRVIVTTNFDRLLERAIEAEGISPQVIASDSAVGGMEPLQHMPCTILKLHGDYASLDQRNTVDELSSYPKATKALLSRILDEYGLVVSGWSGEWDPALVEALEASANRRYPLYWASRSEPGEVARRLLSRSGAALIQGQSADEFFPDLLSRVDALASMSDSPVSLNLSIARLKRLLPDSTKYIELHDLFEVQLNVLRPFLRDRPMTPPDNGGGAAEAGHLEIVNLSNTLLRLYATGIYLDRDESNSDLWVSILQQAIRARSRKTGTYVAWWDALQHLPALLLLAVGVAAALGAGHERLAVRLLGEPVWADPFQGNEPRPAWDVLHTWVVLDHDIINGFPSSGDTNWKYAQSHFLKQAALPVVESLVGDSAEALRLFHQTEYRFALATAFLEEKDRYFMRAAGGEFLLERNYSRDSSASAWAEEFMRNGAPEAWGLGSKFDADQFAERMSELTTNLEKVTRW